jgi:oxygen-independent coproporphyrinogen-3 oxidase
LGQARLSRLGDKLSTVLDLERLQERTIEVNPHDLTEELVECLVKYHFNRVSIGVQSFNPKIMGILGRDHTYEDIASGMKLLHEHGIDNINLDLMYGINGFGMEDLKDDLDKLVSLKPKHVSCYSLILEEKTILYHKYQKGEFSLMDEDLEADMYFYIIDYLHKAGYEHYETSNFCLPGYESRHNLIYWNNERYLGLGAGSSYYLENTRYTNVRNLREYFAGVDDGNIMYEEEIPLSENDRMKEEMILGLRLTKGVNIKTFREKYAKDVFEVFPVIEQLMKEGWLKREGDLLAIPYDKLYLANHVLVNFI